MSFSKRVFSCVVVCFLASLMAGSASAVLVALSENSSTFGLGKSVDLDPAFSGMGAGDMVFSSTDDASIVKTGDNAISGAAQLLGGNGSVFVLTKFDLSSLAGATITKAQIQYWGYSGNQNINNSKFGAINSFNWSEGSVTSNSPVGTVNTPEWGTGSTIFDIDAGVDVPSITAADSVTAFQTYTNPTSGNIGHIVGRAVGSNIFSYYLVEDVTLSLQSMIDGSNLGWAGDLLNYSGITSSENEVRSGFSGSNFGTGTKPILFVDYTVSAVPEPSAFLMVGLVFGLGWLKKRGR